MPTDADPVTETARRLVPDRYLAALYAPSRIRGELLALAAFAGEQAEINSRVREPMLREIKRQWWRDALAAGLTGDITGHPVADRISLAVRDRVLSGARLLAWIDSFGEARPIADWPDAAAFEANLDATEGSHFAICARLLGGSPGLELQATCRSAGIAYGLASALAAAPVRHPALEDRARKSLAEALVRVRRLDSGLLPGFLPLVMVEPYLRAAEARTGEVQPLTRWWRMWRASVRGSL